MDVFEDCLIDADLSGIGTGPEVPVIWDRIYTEFCELSSDGSLNEVLELMKEINDLRGKIAIVNASVIHLQMVYTQEIVDLLNSLALQCTLKPEDKGGILVAKLNNVVARMKKWFPRLATKEKELAALRSANSGKIDRAYFSDWYDAIGAERGYHIKPADLTVARFCRALTKIKAEELKRETNGNRKNR